MIIDNVVASLLTRELANSLINGKIEKIFLVDKYTFIFQIWLNRKTIPLVFSFNPENFRLHYSNRSYVDSKSTPTFLLQLKKNIESGYIKSVEQINNDRIIVFTIESTNIVKDKVIYKLIFELTGKYANLILVSDTLKILGSLVIVDETKSQERSVFPGANYVPITNKFKKSNILELSYENFIETISLEPNKTLKNLIINKLIGFSSNTLKCLLSEEWLNKSYSSFSESDLHSIYETLGVFWSKLAKQELYLDINNKDQFGFTYEKNEESISAYLDNYFSDKEAKNKFINIKQDLERVLNKHKIKISQKLEEITNDLKNSESSEQYKNFSDLIYANLYHLPEKAKNIQVENFFEENQLITIELDENKTLNENAQAFIKKYNKLKNAKSHLLGLEKKFLDEFSYIEDNEVNINMAENYNDFEMIEQELIEQEYLLKKKKSTKKASALDLEKRLMHFTTSDGFEVIIGKNNTQNDYLTNKLAKPNDIWLHTRLIPGSHVVIKNNKEDKEISYEAIKEAALLAAQYSKAKFSSNVCVIYTAIKNIKKPSGSKPGFVLYAKEKAIYVTPVY